MRAKDAFCRKACGVLLQRWWHFCPACGRGFGRSSFGTVQDSIRARDGKVEPRTALPLLLAEVRRLRAEAALLGVHRRARAAAFDKAAQLADTRAEMATDPRVYAVCMHLSARLRALAAREKEGT